MRKYLTRLKPDDKKMFAFKSLKEWREWYYKIYIKSKHFRDMSKETLKYFEYKCIVCYNKAVVAHHTKHGYLNLWHEIPGRDTLALCNSHHAIIQEVIKPGRRMREIENGHNNIDVDKLIAML